MQCFKRREKIGKLVASLAENWDEQRENFLKLPLVKLLPTIVFRTKSVECSMEMKAAKKQFKPVWCLSHVSGLLAFLLWRLMRRFMWDNLNGIVKTESHENIHKYCRVGRGWMIKLETQQNNSAVKLWDAAMCVSSSTAPDMDWFYRIHLSPNRVVVNFR